MTTDPPDLPADAALFLDFDGCLVDIAARPDAIVVPQTLPGLLDSLHRRLDGAVALISGRNVADLRRYLPDFPGAIAGSHGAEMALPGKRIEPVDAAELDVGTLHGQARDLAAHDSRLMVEPKPHGVVMHYRAAPDLAGWVDRAMTGLASHYPALAVQPAKMAVELRPRNAGKNRALARLMQFPDFAGRLPVYAGDDLTDEIAMTEAQARGGFAIKVGEGETGARYRLSDPAALARWLDSGLSA